MRQQTRSVPRRSTLLALVATSLLAAALRAYHLGFHTLWYDETFTAWVADQSPWDIIQINIADVVHPPLYYLLLSAWTRLVGSSEFGLRLLSAGISLLGVPLLYRLGRQGWDRRTGLAAALLWACSPFAIWFAQEARMYAMLTMVALGAIACLVESLPRGSWRWLLAGTALNLLGLYTHYFYLFALLSQYLYLALTLRRHRRAFWRWFLLNALASTLYLPWIVAIVRNGLSRAQIAWIQPLTARTAWQAFWQLSVGQNRPFTLAAALVAAVLAADLVVAAVSQRKRTPAVVPPAMWASLLVPALLSALISLRQPLFHSRFLQISLPALLLLAAAGLTRIRRRLVPVFILLLIVLAWTPALRSMYTSSTRYGQALDSAVQTLQDCARAGDAIAFRGGQLWHAYWYYYDGPPVAEVNLEPEDGVIELGERAAGSPRVWLLGWDTTLSCRPPPGFVPQPEDRLQIVHVDCFPEVVLVEFVVQTP